MKENGQWEERMEIISIFFLLIIFRSLFCELYFISIFSFHSFFSSSLLLSTFFVSISDSVLVIFILFFIFSVTIFINFFYSCLTILVTTLHALLWVSSSCSFSSIFVSSFSIILILLFIVNVITTHTHRGVPRLN